MSKINEFWQYAKEAAFSASESQSELERETFVNLARTWIQAALMERRRLVDAI
jgi:hypothetical protein